VYELILAGTVNTTIVAQTESESSYPSRREWLPNDYIDNNW
jgi:hypothetical protein